MSKDPLKDAEAITSSQQGAPTSIRFVRVPKTKTGYSLNANIMGADIALALSRRWQAVTVSIHHVKLNIPVEAAQGLQELSQQGVITMNYRGRVWLDITMPNPQHRSLFENWDGDHQTRASNHWEDWWHQGVQGKLIRVG
jgi:hypothetical protein